MFVDNIRMNTNNSKLTGAVYMLTLERLDRSQYVVIDSIKSDLSTSGHRICILILRIRRKFSFLFPL